MRISKKIFISGLFFLLFLFIFVSYLFDKMDFPSFSILSAVTFFLIGIISIIELVKDGRLFSLNKMHWYFILIFMVLTPVTQLSSGYSPWKHNYTIETTEKTNFIVLIWIISYIFAYGRNCTIKPLKKKQIVDLNQRNIVILLALSILSVFILVYKCGFVNLFLRDAAVFGTGTFSILFTYLFRSIPVISLALAIYEKKKKNNIHIITIVLLVVCMIISNFPVALSRYWSGTVYLGVLLVTMNYKEEMSRKLDYLIIFGLIIVFPLFSLFKNMTLSEVIGSKININLFSSFNTVDFDAYSMLGRIIEYVNINGLSWGTQIRSVLLFFVPRAVWNIKGTPTGELVATFQNSYYTNVSGPIMGEAYIDFGIIGVVIYAFIFARLFLKFDKMFWLYRESDIKYVDIIYVFMVGFTIFIMRGSLQPAFLRVMGFYLFLIMIFLYKKIKRIIDKSRNR